MNKRRDNLFSGLMAALLLAGVPPAGAQEKVQDEIARVQAAIKAKGARWAAGETPLSKLSGGDLSGRLGASLEPIDAPPAEVRMTETLPPRIDWRDHGGRYVTGVRDQKKCGSCWSFAMTGALESNILLTRHMPGKDLDLSEQVLVSCSWVGSCNGGLLVPTFVKNTGLPPEADYPYTATDGDCDSAAPGWKGRAYKIGSWGLVSRKLAALKAALAQYGPLPTAYMVYEDFKHYKSGVYSYVSGKKLGGHAVLLVGYDDQEQCFIVKNSWGPDWGEGGFFRIAYSEVDGVVGFGRNTVAYKSPAAAKADLLSGARDNGLDADARLEKLEALLRSRP
ncbi:MAG: C1 family peptidase, partial [Elusimicrobia bacterium]|nr:C1 family peptidase [Elusimicrobiota bacterium]